MRLAFGWYARLAFVAIELGAATALVMPWQALAATPNGEYVALGDSYTSGPGIPPAVAPECGRSGANYPSLVRRKLGSTGFKDMSCGGAVIQNMYTGQNLNPPQLNGLSANTKLVTVSIGSNDIGFGPIVYGCAVQSVYSSPAAPCRTQLTAGGSDSLAARITAVGPRLLSLYNTIKTRASGARVLVVGYPTIFSPTTCPGGFSQADTDYLAKDFAGLNDVIKTQAEAAGVTYVDTASSSADHGFCAPVAQRWLENRTVTHPAVAWHPNGMSMGNTASQIVSAVGSSG